jgi:hypothetical protein
VPITTTVEQGQF